MRSFYLILFLIVVFSSIQGSAQYIENKGQWPENVLFGFSENNIQYFIEKDGITVSITNPLDINYKSIHNIKDNEKDIRKYAFKITWSGSTFAGVIANHELQSGYSNFIGKPEESASFCRHFSAFTFQDVWPGINVDFSIREGKLKYDYMVNTETESIDVQIAGIDRLVVRDQQVFFETSCGAVVESFPDVHCKMSPEKQEDFTLQKTSHGYRIALPPSPLPLVVDPVLEGASYVGATGADTGAGALGFGSNYFDDGAMLGFALYNGEGTYPFTIGAFVETPMNVSAIGISKFSSDLSTLEWSTTISGFTWEYELASLIADGEIVLVMACSQYPGYYGGINGIQPLPPLVPDSSELGFYESYLHVTVISEDGSQLLRSRLIGSVSMDMFSQISNTGMSGFVADIDQTSDGDYVVVCL